MKRIIFQLLFLTALILPFASACNEDENNPPRQELPDAPENSDDSDSTLRVMCWWRIFHGPIMFQKGQMLYREPPIKWETLKR